MKKIFSIVLIIACFTSNSYSQKSVSALPESKMKDVAYGSFESSKMDVYLPANRTSQTPFVVFIHGGAWVLGDKIWGSRTQDTLLAHGIASVNINYRFADDNNIHYKDLLADIDTAVSFCIAHAAEWNTRKTKFVINGESAGAHLALMYGFIYPGKISTIISECAPTNLADTSLLNYYAQHDTSLLHSICKMVGAKYDPAKQVPPAFAVASPVSYVMNVPTLFFHGTADWVVPYQQAASLENAFKSKNVIYRFVPMKDAGHDLGLNTSEGRGIIYAEILRWIEQYGK